jgi:carbamoyltransferase
VKIASVNWSHNCSVTLLEDGEIKFFLEEERISRVKYDEYPFHVFNALKEYTDEIDYFIVSGLTTKFDSSWRKNTKDKNDQIESLKLFLYKFFKVKEVIIDYVHKHHMCHASCAFYNSGFENAVIIVLDALGADKNSLDEIESGYSDCEAETVFEASYPSNFKTILSNRYIERPDVPIQNQTVGLVFQIASEHCGFYYLDGGKVMGLSAFGKDSKLPAFYLGDNMSSNSIYPEFLFKNKTQFKKEDVAFAAQRDTQKRVDYLINKIIKKTDNKNYILTGGYAMNCVNNYRLVEKYKDINFYIDPMSTDAGVSYGAVKHFWHKLKNDNTVRKLKNLYLGDL